MWNKETIQDKISSDINWTIRTLEVLFNRQTTDEQSSGQTSHQNGRGFNGRDSEILTSFYYQVQKRKQYRNPILLTDRQLEICQKMLKKYWRQVLEEIELKMVVN
jgi:hypothetical protein